ncbi:MAG: ATP synthase subunit I [Lachnospiraceae bacterium]
METEGKTMLYELFSGIAVFTLVELLGNLFIKQRLPYSLGVLLGAVIAVFMASHMYFTLGQAMLYEEEAAAKKIKRGSFLRMAVMVIGMILAVLLPEYISLLGVLLGILTLKFAAYLQPLTHKLFNKILSKGR